MRFWGFCEICGTSTADVLADGRTGLTVEASSSSEEYGFSRAVLKESVRELGYLSLIGGRNANGIARGGVTSGVGGLCCWFIGVLGVDGESAEVLIEDISNLGAGASVGWDPEDCRE